MAGGLVIAALALGCWWQRSAAAQPASAPVATVPAATAQVKVAAIVSTRITATAVAYGTVTARPGKSNTLSLPFECVVRHVLVAPGESVAAGQPVLEIGPSPATRLKIAQAKAALAAANDELQQIRDRYNLNFATNQDLSQARKAADAARLDWENLAGIEKQSEVVAERPAVVGRVWVQDGQFVPAGQPLAELVPHDQIEVKFGLEPGDEDHLQVGDAVKLFLVGREQAPAIAGRIRLVTHRISPDTQLVAVYVTPPAGTPLLLEDYLRGEFNIASNVGLVVPRAALLPEGDANVLYTVSGGHAVRHAVQTGLSTGQQVEVVGSGLQAGQQIVVSGNHELSDGMAVALNSEP
jgi:RND family efflux transporter MFP subunit